MSNADDERAAGQGNPRPEAAAGASDDRSDAQFRTLLAAGAALVAALRHLLTALRTLAVAEVRVVVAVVPLFFIGAIALVALSVSLWVCVVALVGWALTLATHSAGIALGVLVVGHVILILGVWFAIKYSLRQATFPRARAELRRLGHSLRGDISRFADATPATGSASPEESKRAPHQRDKA